MGLAALPDVGEKKISSVIFEMRLVGPNLKMKKLQALKNVAIDSCNKKCSMQNMSLT